MPGVVTPRSEAVPGSAGNVPPASTPTPAPGTGPDPPPKRKRGRPPGSKNKHPSAKRRASAPAPAPAPAPSTAGPSGLPQLTVGGRPPMPTFVSTSPRDNNSSYASRPPGDEGNPLFSPENDPSEHLPGAKLAYMDCIEDDKYRVVDHCPPGGVALTGRPLEKGVVDGVGGGSDQCIYITAKVDGVLLRGVLYAEEGATEGRGAGGEGGGGSPPKK